MIIGADDGLHGSNGRYSIEGEFMAKLTGLASFVSELKVERTNLVDRLRHVDAALSVLGK
jgi:hypothetical protein